MAGSPAVRAIRPIPSQTSHRTSIAQSSAPVSFRGRETFDLAVSTLGLDIEALDIDVAELDPKLVGAFDVVLFLGVFYHLLDPLDALTRAAGLAKRFWLLNRMLICTICDAPLWSSIPALN
jgi:hypothetical protein